MKIICPKCNYEFLSKDNTSKLLDLLRKKKTVMNISQLAKELKLSRPTIYHHISKLKKQGLIQTYRIKLKYKKPKGNPLFIKLNNIERGLKNE